ncbi:ASI1-immunoprecipitated protein 3-like [Rutidosis leptorrhynchoides]|uniref:ASI1-immunoprecipitated protein 3-like n=1 Tax=Rutidosis leptorrhynchoides TaxID=125765 RepID=UPI003A99E2E7
MLNKLCHTSSNVVAKPIGDVARVSVEGSHTTKHYKAFEFYGNIYEIGDTVFLAPESSQGGIVKPYVAIIREISQKNNGRIMLTVQWFYRPEDVETKKGKILESNDSRDLFYSFHKNEIAAESILHKCVVHFIPEHNLIPKRKEHPGFIVQKVYDLYSKRLLKLNDTGYIEFMQQEIDQLVDKTMCRLGIVPDARNQDLAADCKVRKE